MLSVRVTESGALQSERNASVREALQRREKSVKVGDSNDLFIILVNERAKKGFTEMIAEREFIY